MLNRLNINFGDIYSYAKPQLPSDEEKLHIVETGILNADKDVAESNLETIKKYSYIYCESDYTFASQVKREMSVSAKHYGMYGLNAAGIGIGCMTLWADSAPTFISASAMSLALGLGGGIILGGIKGGFNALLMRQSDNLLLKTPEEKKRVAELQKLAECRVAFFHRETNNRQVVSEEKPVLNCR